MERGADVDVRAFGRSDVRKGGFDSVERTEL
jgi:hypothetical protein